VYSVCLPDKVFWVVAWVLCIRGVCQMVARESLKCFVVATRMFCVIAMELLEYSGQVLLWLLGVTCVFWVFVKVFSVVAKEATRLFVLHSGCNAVARLFRWLLGFVKWLLWSHQGSCYRVHYDVLHGFGWLFRWPLG